VRELRTIKELHDLYRAFDTVTLMNSYWFQWPAYIGCIRESSMGATRVFFWEGDRKFAYRLMFKSFITVFTDDLGVFMIEE
jgi:hypothetical protein